LARQDAEGWGAKVIDRLAKDLGNEFPGVEGFSTRNLKYMRSMAAAWPDSAIVPQPVALLPWGHLRVLLDRVKDGPTRDWYLRAAVEYGWSRDIMVHQIAAICTSARARPSPISRARCRLEIPTLPNRS
jgi:predicted nuclease of restriction endonuclease-like (RecB) superfamily